MSNASIICAARIIRLSQVGKCAPSAYGRDGFPFNSCALGYRDVCQAMFSKFPNLKNCFVRHPAPMSLFSCHVEHVFGMGSKEKMRRVHAWSHVASVTNKEPIEDLAICQFPRKSVCRYGAVFHIERAIAAFKNGSRPEPARVGFFDFRPKAACIRAPVRIVRFGVPFKGGAAMSARERSNFYSHDSNIVML